MGKIRVSLKLVFSLILSLMVGAAMAADKNGKAGADSDVIVLDCSISFNASGYWQNKNRVSDKRDIKISCNSADWCKNLTGLKIIKPTDGWKATELKYSRTNVIKREGGPFIDETIDRQSGRYTIVYWTELAYEREEITATGQCVKSKIPDRKF